MFGVLVKQEWQRNEISGTTTLPMVNSRALIVKCTTIKCQQHTPVAATVPTNSDVNEDKQASIVNLECWVTNTNPEMEQNGEVQQTGL